VPPDAPLFNILCPNVKLDDYVLGLYLCTLRNFIEKLDDSGQLVESGDFAPNAARFAVLVPARLRTVETLV